MKIHEIQTENLKMAEDLGEEWWETKTKNSKNDKIEDEGKFHKVFTRFYPLNHVNNHVNIHFICIPLQ